MIQLDKTFPTLDCSACILTPKTTEVGSHPDIKLITFAEVMEVSGYIGNFKVKIRKKKRYVDVSKCNGCGTCWNVCPTLISPQERVIKKGDQVIKIVSAPNKQEATHVNR
jgi:heterodisulfide reductase subunit A